MAAAIPPALREAAGPLPAWELVGPGRGGLRTRHNRYSKTRRLNPETQRPNPAELRCEGNAHRWHKDRDEKSSTVRPGCCKGRARAARPVTARCAAGRA